MKKKSHISIAIICLALLAATTIFLIHTYRTSDGPLAAVTPPSSQTQAEPNEAFLASLDDFAYASAAQVLADASENTNYAPLSLYYALSLTATGAQGDTAAEFMDVLGVSDADELSAQCERLYGQLYMDGEESKLTLANSLWMSKRLPFHERFVQNAAANFYAHSFSVDFKDIAKTEQMMADWIIAYTNQTIAPKLAVSSEEALVILNTLYFFDRWAWDFEEYKTHEDEFFTTPDATPVLCDFMHRDDYTDFAKGDGFTRSSIPLAHGGSMVFVLPDEDTPVQALLADETALREAFQGGIEGEDSVLWSIPKFKFTSYFNLNNAAYNLGIQSAFDGNLANFLGISDRPTFIERIIQETSVGINEYGVEAGAYTAVYMEQISDDEPPTGIHMNLNRPFLYSITAPNGSLLFIGVCMNPTV